MSFEKLIRPNTVAVVGASSNPAKVGHALLKNILDDGFEGKVYPVNPNESEVLGKKSYNSIIDVPGVIDLAVIVVKRDIVIPILKDCARKSVEAVIIITAGFGEADNEGKKLQQEIVLIARQKKITILGPNLLWMRLIFLSI